MQCQRIEIVMGTGVDIDVRRASVPFDDVEKLVDACFTRLREIDTTFTTYDSESVISRIGRGEIDPRNYTQDVRDILRLCETLHATTDGWFDPWLAATTEPACSNQVTTNSAARPIEPSGVVKGWAIEQTVEMLRAGGATDFCVYAGGDIYVSGQESEGQPWRLGITHPVHTDERMDVLALRDAAMATSGLYARGSHIVSSSERRLGELLSLTVIGPDATLADAYATAAFAMGRAGITWIHEQPGFEVYAVDAAGMAFYSPALASLLIDD